MELSTSIENLIGSGLGSAVGTAAVLGLVWLFRTSLGSYLAKRAENFATKQDIQNITQLQEEVKAEFAQIRESQRTETQLRLAVAERRFEAHQEAFTLWNNLYNNVFHGEEVHKIVKESQQWWVKNSLYLDAEARIAFKKAIFSASMHQRYTDITGPARDHDLIEKNWDQLTNAGAIIEAAVHLPSLGPLKPGEPDDA